MTLLKLVANVMVACVVRAAGITPTSSKAVTVMVCVPSWLKVICVLVNANAPSVLKLSVNAVITLRAVMVSVVVSASLSLSCARMAVAVVISLAGIVTISSLELALGMSSGRASVSV